MLKTPATAGTARENGNHHRRMIAVNNSTCSVSECSNKVVARGWCSKHYQRWKIHGDPSRANREIFFDPEESFRHYTEWQGDCLIWTGHLNDGGYGRLTVNGERIRAHRYAWERANGPIPSGYEIDHACHNRACVNANHLRPADRGQNGANQKGARADSSSGVRNVHRHRGRWRVRLMKDQVEHTFGYFDTIEEAAVVAEQARQDLFGDYAGRG